MGNCFRKFVAGMLALCSCGVVSAAAPDGLMTDLAEHTDRVWLDGYLSDVALDETDGFGSRAQTVRIASARPAFSWIVNDDRPDVVQTAYQLQVASSPGNLNGSAPDQWNSGEVQSNRSVAVIYEGAALVPNTVYYWRVRTQNNGQWQPWSGVKAFRTAPELQEYAAAYYPLQKTDEYPVRVAGLNGKETFVDFGRAAFGQLRLTLFSESGEDTVRVRLGECLLNGRIDPAPGGGRRYLELSLPLIRGTHTYKLRIPADERNTIDRAVHMPSYIGEVYPFRYCEVAGYPGRVDSRSVCRVSVNYPFDDAAVRFTCSDTVLNQVWELCRYSVKATSFAGIYVDGDRERIPYEADALINQLCHYGVDREYTMARRSHEYLLENATWPTEWIMQSVIIAWNDYLYTGDDRSLRRYYDLLKNKTLLALADGRGFISVVPEKLTPEFYESIRLRGQTLKDIVDWPHTGILGLGKAEGGETDGFVFREVNTVSNAYHYHALDLMGRIAAALGNCADAEMFAARAGRLKTNFNKQLWDKKTGTYVDGIGAGHSSLHGNMFPLAFGLADGKAAKSTAQFVRSRGMACSVYGAQFLMDALYEAGAADYALELLTSTAERSWYNMIRVGSTVSLEAWDNKYKPNQDWNHAWGAVPANIVPRKLMGVEPTEAGFAAVRIKPQPGALEQAEMVLPTVRGDIGAAFTNRGDFVLETRTPANMKTEVWLPVREGASRYEVTFDGKPVRTAAQDGFVRIADVGSGKHTFTVEYE